MFERDLYEGVNIKVFSRPGCGDCVELEDIIVKNRIPHTLTNVLIDEDDKDEATRICRGFGKGLTLPVLLVTQIIHGEVDSVAAYIEPRGKPGLESVIQALLAFCKPVQKV